MIFGREKRNRQKMLFLVILLAVSALSKHSYTPYYLCAPFSSFSNDLSLNLTNIQYQAKFCADHGVNIVWINGGMSQFQALTLEERKQVAVEWVKEGHKQGLEVLIHVTDLVVTNANMLAKHAQQIGADYIATLPPFYQKPSGVDGIIEWIKAVTDGVDLGVFYYHIPGSTGVEVNIYDFLEAADANIPNFQGIKYVDTHDNIWQFEKCLNFKSGKYAKGMMWASEPKLAAFPFGARSVILAEAFYAKYYNEMTHLWDAKEVEKAYELQKWIQEVHEIVSGGGGKNVYRGFGFDLGPNRLPGRDHTEQQIDDMLKKLRDIGFFD